MHTYASLSETEDEIRTKNEMKTKMKKRKEKREMRLQRMITDSLSVVESDKKGRRKIEKTNQ